MPRRRPTSPELAALNVAEVRALAALLEHGGIPAAAVAIGTNERTLRRWVARPAFQAALAAERRTLLDGALSRLAGVAGAAVAALLAVLNDPSAAPTAKVSAARVILEHAFEGVAGSDVDARLSLIERKAAGRAPPGEQDAEHDREGQGQVLQ